MKKYLIVSILTIAFKTSETYAQTSSFDLPSFHPVSPNAASLGKFGLYPASNNLGTVPVNIPIYTLTERGITIPISLNYNTSGIRLNELASWVGLGWSLNAGGAIVRNTEGLPDRTFTESIHDLENAEFNSSNWGYMLTSSRGESDTAPDQYVLNALGVSGSFYVDRSSGKAEFEDGSPIRIDFIATDEIHAILEDGTKLIFGKGSDGSDATEVTDSHLDPNYAADFISAWYLAEVISSDQHHQISFKYKYNTAGDTNLEVWRDYSQPISESVVLGPGVPSPATNYLRASTGQLATVKKKYLEKIIFNTGYIEFESSLTRDDLEHDFKLDAIKVYTNGDPGPSLIDQYHFSYDYFVRSGGVFSNDYESNPIFFDDPRQVQSRNKSLKLLHMRRGPAGSVEKHIFEYNTTTMPVRCTTAQDSWGYMNSNTGSLMPQTFTTTVAININDFEVGDGDRSVNESKAKASILEKIIYPTGGHTVFEHEANRITETKPTFSRISHSLLVYGYGQDVNGDDCGPHYDDEPFTIPDDATNIKLGIALSPADYLEQGVEQPYVAINDKKYYRPSPNSSGGPVDSSDGWFETINIYFGDNFSDDLSAPSLFLPGEFVISAFDSGYGSIESGVGTLGCTSMSIRISWDQPGLLQEVETLIGGLRIASISNYDGHNSSPASMKKYEYANPNLIRPQRNRGYIRKFLDNQLIISAKVSTSPYFNNNLDGEPAIEYGAVTEYLFNPSTLRNEGKTVYIYESVPSIRQLNTIIPGIPFMHSEFSYQYQYSTSHISGNIGVWPKLQRAIYGLEEFSHYQTTAWKRGSLLFEQIYKMENHQEILLRSTNHGYQTISSLNLKSNYIQLNFETFPFPAWNLTTPYDQEVDFNSLYYTYQVSDVELGRKVRSSTTVTQYDDQGENPVVTTTNYSYENPIHKQLTKTETIDSKDETIITLNYYPDDVTGVSSLVGGNLAPNEYSIIDRLKATRDDSNFGQHRINQIIQTESYRDFNNDGNTDPEELISTKRNIFSDWNNDLLVPGKIMSLKGPETPSNQIEERVIFHYYDDLGNPREVSKANDVYTVYVWGYNQTLPIAKIENAGFLEIPTATLTDLQNKSNEDDDTCLHGPNCKEQALRDVFKDLRNIPALADALVTTYTYDPLIGLTSQTDPNGKTTYYEYDGNGRLINIKDHEENILQRYEYHIKGQ